MPLADFTPPRQARALRRLNLRRTPGTELPRSGVFDAGQVFEVAAVVMGEDLLGSASWLRLTGGRGFVWAGAVDLEEPVAAPAPAAAAMDVRRRPNGTIRPIPTAALGAVFGAFDFRDGARRGAIEITDPADWATRHLVAFDHPILRGLGRRPQPVHRLAEPHLRAVFDAIVERGLQDLILTFDGSFVPRYKNWNPASGELSSHSWGIAIDLNQRFNPAGRQPALPGETGCLRELVPLFAAQGYAWGGHFERGVDGMHFELARRDPGRAGLTD